MPRTLVKALPIKGSSPACKSMPFQQHWLSPVRGRPRSQVVLLWLQQVQWLRFSSLYELAWRHSLLQHLLVHLRHLARLVLRQAGAAIQGAMLHLGDAQCRVRRRSPAFQQLVLSDLPQCGPS